jgi:menaquinone-9 beta-reductase
METCDALIVGGGPAGSSCAWKLRQAGVDVLVVDAAVFPRDKVCGGWVTPQVFAELGIDPVEYRQGRTLQPITGFRCGFVGGRREIETRYADPVSYGIRRCEFDQYLLRRSNARVMQGTPIVRIQRAGGHWIVNDTIRTRMLVGAGGQFCSVARHMNGPANLAPLVVAQEAEFPIDEPASVAIEHDVPELYFSRDLNGYGWCVRKQEYLNLGFGRLGGQALPKASEVFAAFLKARRKIGPGVAWRWRGHAYALYGLPHRRIVDEGLVLVGDAAGLAYPQSGEGIRPAVESGLLAAATIVEARGDYARHRLAQYEDRLRARLGTGTPHRALSRLVSTGPGTALARRIMQTPSFMRHIVLDRWFLHARQPALSVS